MPSIEINPYKMSDNKSMTKRDVTDLRKQLQNQYKFLCRSLIEIRKGNTEEISRVAIHLNPPLFSQNQLFNTATHYTGFQDV
jgi:hypothetical protein